MLSTLSISSIFTHSGLTHLLASTVGASTVGNDTEAYAKTLALAITFTTVLVFISAQILGEVAVRIGLPAVLGELIAGFIIGVSGIHLLVLGNGSQVADWAVATVQFISGGDGSVIREIFADPVKILINQYAEIGVGVLLFKIGLEADLKELIKVGPQAASVAIAGVTLPFIAGFWGLLSLFHLGIIPAIFGAAALTATSIGITSRIMQDMGVLNTTEGQIILGAAVLDDILGIAILAIAVGIAEQGTIEISSVFGTIVSATLFVLAAIALNKFFGPRYINFLDGLNNRYSVLIGAIIFLSVMGTIAEVIGLEGILGCFAAGIVLGDTKATQALEKACDPLVALFATIFFVTIGAKTDLTVLNLANPESQVGLVIALFLIVVAIVGKVAAGYFVFTQDPVDRLAIGTGMVPRGEVRVGLCGIRCGYRCLVGISECCDCAHGDCDNFCGSPNVAMGLYQ